MAESQHLVQFPELPRFRLIRAGDLKPRPLDWLIHGLFERNTLVEIFGDPGAAKTFWALDLACCIASGTDHHGRAVKQGCVAYVAGEGQNGLARRLKAWAIRNGPDLTDIPLYVSTMPAMMTDAVNVCAVPDALASLDDPPTLVILDTVARNFGPGDENSTADMTAFVRGCDELRIATGCTVVLVHHAGHAEKARSRGSSVLYGAVDTRFRLSRSQDVIEVTCAKQKDGPMPEPFAFEFRTVELGFANEDGTEASSAVLYPVDVPTAPAKATGKNQKSALDHLDEVTAHHRANLHSAGRDPDGACVTLNDWRDWCMKRGMRRQGWYQAKNSLVDLGLISIESGGFIRRSET